MSIFSRSSAKETTAAPPADAAAQAAVTQSAAEASRFAPPAAGPAAQATRPAAPGVVPPPAAPLYSMRPADDVEISAGERARIGRDAQLRAKDRVTSRRERALSSTTQVVRRRAIQPPSTPAPLPARQQFDPLRAAQTGLLKLAWSWQQAGSPIRAIHAYMELLFRYPDSAAADAAVADLVQLSDKLASEGQFHTALGIYEHLEHWATMEDLV